MTNTNATGTTAAPMPAVVADVFDSYDERIRPRLLELRELILSTASETEGVGAITECLKWGQPAYVTNETRSGSTIRLAPTADGSDHDYALFFICHTNLVEHFDGLFGTTLTCEGNRAIVFHVDDELPTDELRACVEMALTYHRKG